MNKGNQTVKFDLVIEYNKEIFVSLKIMQKMR